MSLNLDAAKTTSAGFGMYLSDGPIRIELMDQIPTMFQLTETQFVPGVEIPSATRLDVAGYSYGYDYAASVEYILQCLPESQALGFKEEIVEAAALACNTGELYTVRNLIENWEATAETYAIPSEALSLPVHEDFGIPIEVTTLLNDRVGPYHVVKPLDLRTYKNSDGFTSVFNVFSRIIGIGETSQESQDNAKRHLLHSRDFYEVLPLNRGTEGAKRQSVLMKQYLQ